MRRMRLNRKQRIRITLAAVGMTALFAAACFCWQLLIACRTVRESADRYLQAVDSNCEVDADVAVALLREREEALLQLTRSIAAYYDGETFRGALESPAEEQTHLLQRVCAHSDAELLLITDDRGAIVFSSDAGMMGENIMENGLFSQEFFGRLPERANTSAFGEGDAISLLTLETEDGFRFYIPYNAQIEVDGARYHLIVLADYQEISNGMEGIRSNKLLFETGSGDLFSVVVNLNENIKERYGRIFYCEYGGADYEDRHYTELGLTDAALADGYTGFQRINGVFCYCRSTRCDYFGNDILIVIVGDVFRMLNVPALLCVIAVFAWFCLYLMVYGPQPVRADGHRLLAMATTGVLAVAGVAFYAQTLSGLSSAIRQTELTHRLLCSELAVTNRQQQVAREASERIGVSQASLIRMTAELRPARYFAAEDPDAYREYAVTGESGYSVPLTDDMGYPLRSVCSSGALRTLCDEFDMVRISLYNADGYTVADSGSEWYGHITRESPETAPLFDVLDRRKDFDVSVPDGAGGLRRIAVPMDYYVRDGGEGTAFVTEEEYSAYCREPDGSQPVRRRYGLLVCWQEVPQTLLRTGTETMNFIASSRETMQNCRLILADASDKHILYCEAWNGEADDAEFPDAIFRGGNSGFFDHADQRCFFRTERYYGEFTDGLYIVSVYPLSVLHARRAGITAATALAAAVLLTALALALIFAKRPEAVAAEDADRVIPSTGPYSWINPAVIFPFGALFIWASSDRWHSSILRYILVGAWEHGVNLFSLSLCGFMIAALILLARQMRYVGKFLCFFRSRGETLMRLILSAVKYGAYIFVIFYSLYLFGLDTASVLRSLGAFALIVSLGAQSLIKDVIAGVFLVFDGTYHIGDIVQINDIRGRIVEVSLRTTRIENLQGTVMTFNNSAIVRVENLSENDSSIFFEIQVPADKDPDQFREDILPWLEDVCQRNQEIRGKVEYDGIIETQKDHYVVRLVAHCREQDRGKLWRKVNREIVRLTQSMKLY